jgi:hypothetical protein
MEKLSLKTSKATKLSKYYSLKQAKSNKIISFTLPTRKFEEKKASFEIVFSHTKVVFSSPKSAKKGQNMTILSYFSSLQSSLYTKNHRFT